MAKPPFGVAYATNKDLVREAGMAAAEQIDGTIRTQGREPDVWLVSFGDSSLNFELIVWVEHKLLIAPGRTQAKYLWAIESELAARGIEIPFPQRDLHLRSGTVRIENGSVLFARSRTRHRGHGAAPLLSLEVRRRDCTLSRGGTRSAPHLEIHLYISTTEASSR